MPLLLADAAAEASFVAYRNYFEDLAGVIGGRFGWHESLVDGVFGAVLAEARHAGLRERPLRARDLARVNALLRRSWAHLGAVEALVSPPEGYDGAANAWIPLRAYHAVHAALCAFAVAEGRRCPADHRAARDVAADIAVRNLLPFPWSAWCDGCPQVATTRYGGVIPVDEVSALAPADPRTSDARLAMLLRTTRARELEQRFGELRRTHVRPGRTRRNLTAAEKRAAADQLPPTTVFDVLWRVRGRASEAGEVFVFGAGDVRDATRFADALLVVVDATVAAVEALVAQVVGVPVHGELAASYARSATSVPPPTLARRLAAARRATV